MTDATPSDTLTDLRRRKDAQFASGRDPVQGAALEQFTGLSYYPPDAQLVFQLLLERGVGEQVTLQTSTGELRQMQAFGAVSLSIAGEDARLTLYARPGQ